MAFGVRSPNRQLQRGMKKPSVILKRTTRMLSAFKRAVRVVRALQGFPFFPRRPPSSTRLFSSPPPTRNAAVGGRTAARGPSPTETVALGPFARPLAHFLPLSLTLVYLPPCFPLSFLPSPPRLPPSFGTARPLPHRRVYLGDFLPPPPSGPAPTRILGRHFAAAAPPGAGEAEEAEEAGGER